MSRFFRTPAFPAGSGPDYVNAAALLETVLDPEALLAYLHGIEADLGRTRRVRWAERTIDLDIVFHGDSLLPDAATVQTWIDLPADALSARRATRRRVMTALLGDAGQHGPDAAVASAGLR